MSALPDSETALDAMHGGHELSLERLLADFAPRLPEEKVLSVYLGCDGNLVEALALLLAEAGAGDYWSLSEPPSPVAADVGPAILAVPTVKWSEDASESGCPGLEALCLGEDSDMADPAPRDPFQVMKTTFPTVDAGVLKALLEAEGNDLQAAIQSVCLQFNLEENLLDGGPCPGDAPLVPLPVALAPAPGCSEPIDSSPALTVPIKPGSQTSSTTDLGGSPASPLALLSSPDTSPPQTPRPLLEGDGFFEGEGLPASLTTEAPQRAETWYNAPPRLTRQWHQARQAEFAANRGRVRRLVERRDALNQAAVEASRSDDPQRAAQLRREAAAVQAEVRALEKNICEEMSAAVNARHAPRGGHLLAALDLHCQTVAGALGKLEGSWKWLAGMPHVYNLPCVLPIITGRGRHSVGGEAKIRTAVLEWLGDRGYQWELAEDGGSVYVHLPWRPAPAWGQGP